MIREIILTRGLDMTGKLYGYREGSVEGEITIPSELNGTRVILTYVDTTETKYHLGKQRRIFELVKVERLQASEGTQRAK